MICLRILIILRFASRDDHGGVRNLDLDTKPLRHTVLWRVSEAWQRMSPKKIDTANINPKGTVGDHSLQKKEMLQRDGVSAEMHSA